MKRLKLNLTVLAEIMTAGMVGLITGAFLGAFPFGFGMKGAIIGGAIGLVLLTALILLLHLKNWETAKTIAKYASIGVLPGVLIGGSKIVGLGVTGAQLFGLASAIIYATVIYKLVDYLIEKERYILYPGHYGVLFLLGSISVFITILVVDVLTNVFDFEALILQIPFLLTITSVGVTFIFIYLLSVVLVKRKLLTWSEAFRKRLSLFLILIGIFALILIVSALTRNGLIPLNSMVYIAAGILVPYGIGLGLPLSLGFLMAHNENRPVMGSVFSIIGSGFVMFIGIQVAPMLLLPGSGLMWAGLITGLFMLMFALSALFKPETHFFAGLSIIIFSILSFLGAAGGLIIGGILGLVGGILIASWAGRDHTVTHDPDTQQSKGSKDLQVTPSDTITG